MRQLARLALALTAGLWLALLPAAGLAQAPAAVRQVYLIQNSGWMQPFYTDRDSVLRPVVKGLVEHTAQPGGAVTVASFNQDGQVAGQSSPNPLYAGAYDQAAVAVAVDRLRPARKTSGAYADTDLRGALVGAVGRLLQGQDGIVWIVTNNKNSPDNSAAVDANTQRFYREIQSSPSITGIVAFLVLNPVQGEDFSEQGLVIYGLAKGEAGARALQALTAPGAPLRARVFEQAPPVRLKPLDRQPVRLEITRVQPRPGQGVTADTRGGVLRIRGVPAGEAAVFRLEGRLVNTLYPFEIRQAAVQPVWTALQGVGGRQAGEASLRVAPARLTNVGADDGGESVPVTIDVALPALERPEGSWLQTLTAEQAVLRGMVEVRLSDVELAFDPAFRAQAYTLMRVDPTAAGAEAELRRRLPEIFYAHEEVDRSVTRVPVELSVAFSVLPLLAAIAFPLLLFLALVAALIWAGRAIVWRSPTLGESLRLKPGQKLERDVPGGRLRIVRPLLGSPHETVIPRTPA